jgi:hypothetical protein
MGLYASMVGNSFMGQYFLRIQNYSKVIVRLYYKLKNMHLLYLLKPLDFSSKNRIIYMPHNYKL